MDAFIGMILPWAASWAPQDWLICDGSILQVQAYTALFSVIGNAYGGDGRTTFAIPDLRGRMPLGMGAGASPTVHQLGQKSGTESVPVSTTATGSLSIGLNNMPSHTHTAALSLSGLSSTAQTSMTVSTGGNGAIAAPANCQLSTSPTSGGLSAGIFLDAATAPTTPSTMKGFTTTVTTTGNGSVGIGNTGSGQPLPISLPVNANVATMSPFSCVNFIICVVGLYPSRP